MAFSTSGAPGTPGASGASRRRPSDADVFEWASLVTGMASLVAAVVALCLAYAAWTRPYPADPTQVPSWGTGGEPRVIEGPEDARALLDWLERNAGRKVRVNATLESDYFSAIDRNSFYSPSEAGFRTPSEDCDDLSLQEVSDRYLIANGPYCEFIASLEISDSDSNRLSMFWLHGAWQIRGYFASEGLYDFHMGIRTYRIAPLTITDAVG